MHVYHIENVEEVIGFDEYIRDFEEQADEYCTSSAIHLLSSVFSEFTTDMDCSVFLSEKQTKSALPIRFEFCIDVENGQLKVMYTGFD